MFVVSYVMITLRRSPSHEVGKISEKNRCRCIAEALSEAHEKYILQFKGSDARGKFLFILRKFRREINLQVMV